MKLIIDIPENYYKDLMSLKLKDSEHLSYEMEMIRNGTPLPKGHGRIYPLTIIKDRYNGVYSGGKYLAFNLDFDEIPTEVIDNDVTTSNFFYKTDLIYGKGEDIASALLDLDKKIGGET